MSRSYDLGEPEVVTVGTLGPVGQRVFLLQGRQSGQIVTLKVEKQQVAVLSEYLGRLLRQLGRPGHLPGDLELADPADPEWTVGSLALSYDQDEDRIIIVAEELVLPEEGSTTPQEPAPQSDPLADEPLRGGEPPAPGAVARIALTREQAAAFAIRAAALVQAGRPPCPLCGLPLDPEGHQCPRTNGHRPPIT